MKLRDRTLPSVNWLRLFAVGCIVSLPACASDSASVVSQHINSGEANLSLLPAEYTETSTVALVTALEGLAPEGRRFAFAPDVDISQPVARPDAQMVKAARLAAILSSAGLKARDVGPAILLERDIAAQHIPSAAVPAAPVAAKPSVPAAPSAERLVHQIESKTPYPRQSAAARLANSTLMNTPVVHAADQRPASSKQEVVAAQIAAPKPSLSQAQLTDVKPLQVKVEPSASPSIIKAADVEAIAPVVVAQEPASVQSENHVTLTSSLSDLATAQPLALSASTVKSQPAEEISVPPAQPKVEAEVQPAPVAGAEVAPASAPKRNWSRHTAQSSDRVVSDVSASAAAPAAEPGVVVSADTPAQVPTQATEPVKVAAVPAQPAEPEVKASSSNVIAAPVQVSAAVEAKPVSAPVLSKIELPQAKPVVAAASMAEKPAITADSAKASASSEVVAVAAAQPEKQENAVAAQSQPIAEAPRRNWGRRAALAQAAVETKSAVEPKAVVEASVANEAPIQTEQKPVESAVVAEAPVKAAPAQLAEPALAAAKIPEPSPKQTSENVVQIAAADAQKPAAAAASTQAAETVTVKSDHAEDKPAPVAPVAATAAAVQPSDDVKAAQERALLAGMGRRPAATVKPQVVVAQAQPAPVALAEPADQAVAAIAPSAAPVAAVPVASSPTPAAVADVKQPALPAAQNVVRPAQARQAEAPAAHATEQVWVAERGRTLREVLTKWSRQAGVQLIWRTSYDYPLAVTVTVDGAFEDAARKLLNGFAGATPRPYGQLHRQADMHATVLIISTRENGDGE